MLSSVAIEEGYRVSRRVTSVAGTYALAPWRTGWKAVVGICVVRRVCVVGNHGVGGGSEVCGGLEGAWERRKQIWV